MLLCMDENGIIYQASRDREDGRGFEIYPQSSSNGDVYLQSPAIKSAQDVQNQADANSQLNAEQDDQTLQDTYNAQNAADAADQAQQQEDMLNQIPAYKSQLTTEGAIQGMKGADFSRNSIWGASSPLHANGMGRTHNEKAVELALLQQTGKLPPRAKMSGIGEADVSVDQEELEQYQLTQEANQIANQAANAGVSAIQAAVNSGVPVQAPTATVTSSAASMNTVKALGVGLLLLAGINFLRKA